MKLEEIQNEEFGGEHIRLTSHQVLNQLTADDENVTHLRIYLGQNAEDCITSKDEIIAAGNAIGNSTRVVKLVIYGTNSTEIEHIGRARQDLVMLSSGIVQNTSVKILDFINFNNLEAMQLLEPFIKKNPALETIHVDDDGMTTAQIGYLGEYIATRGSPLESLCFDKFMNDDKFRAFFLAFTKAPDRMPLLLRLNSGSSIGLESCQMIRPILQKPNCSLKTWNLDDSREINSNAATILVEGLKENRTLKQLNLRGTSISTIGWSAFSRLLCDTSSVQATYASNHTLQSIGYFGIGLPNFFPVAFRVNLAMNARRDKKFVACRKVLIHHFFSSGFDQVSFSGIEPWVMIHVPAFFDKAIAVQALQAEDREKMCLSFFYQMLRNDPLLCAKKAT